MTQIIVIGGQHGGAVVMHHHSQPIFLESFDASHVHGIAKVTEVSLVVELLLGGSAFLWAGSGWTQRGT